MSCQTLSKGPTIPGKVQGKWIVKSQPPKFQGELQSVKPGFLESPRDFLKRNKHSFFSFFFFFYSSLFISQRHFRNESF